MNKPTHTPGPWKTRINGPFHGSIYSSSHIIASIDRRMATENHECQVSSISDLLLISAAPELLEALQSLITATDHTAYGAALAQARAAIQKATQP